MTRRTRRTCSGWYEVVYEDGFVTTIPIRYGVNIAEWNWEKRDSSHDYAYGADAVSMGGSVANPITFFAFEWVNPRLGKVIKEVRLEGYNGFPRRRSRLGSMISVR